MRRTLGLPFNCAVRLDSKVLGQESRRRDLPQREQGSSLGYLALVRIRALFPQCPMTRFGHAQGKRARNPATRFGGQAVTSRNREAAGVATTECHAALAQERSWQQRLLPERNNLAAGRRNGRLDRDNTLLSKLRGSRDGACRIRQQKIGRDRDVSSRPEDGIGQDLTVLQDDKLRINIDTPTATRAVKNRGANDAVRKLHRAGGRCRNLDGSATRLTGLCRDRALGHGELIARGDLNVAGIGCALVAR